MQRLFSSIFLGLILTALAACTSPEVEPGFGGPVPITRTGLPADENPSPTPWETPITHIPTPWDVPSPAVTPTPWITRDPNATPTPWEPPPDPPTPTPVPPLPGLLYTTDEGLWRVGDDWQPEFLAEDGGRFSSASLSPDGRRLLYQEGADLWLLDLATGETRGLTVDSGRRHCCAQWWPARPGAILFGSWPEGDDFGPSTGHLSLMNVDEGNYTVLDEDHLSNAQAAPGPDGVTIAYDRGGTAWLYRLGDGPEPLEPTAYGLEDVNTIAGPSWSPDGRYLAWTVAITTQGWQIGLAVFDLEAGAAALLHPYSNVGRGGWFPGPAWHPDGGWLAFVAEDEDPAERGVWAVSRDGTEEFYLGDGFNPLWSPDGRWLVFTGPARGSDTLNVGWLIEVSSWYKLMIALPDGLPPGSTIVGWVQPE